MKKEDFFEVLGELDDNIVKGAEIPVKENMVKRPVRVKWGAAAACLCLVVAGAAVLLRQNFSAAPEGNLPPGTRVDGGSGEGMMYSVAVYPADENEENVASADVASLSENEVWNNALAEHLPGQLPEGFHYGRGSIYHTVMKDGTQYNMLRVEYILGTIPEQQYTQDGGAVAPDPDTIGESFIVCVMNYEPGTDINIYSSQEEVTLPLLEEKGAVYIRSGDCCIGVFTETAEPAAVLDALRHIE